ncbi:DUF4367 domain-containing protein [Desulfoscipio gibsoniae]|uniref:DUF4367 domain-containing protein n=1 Tax=Desulfoscipio gibsoniae DSM 7213 TaxID=767817 RepID=R4KIK8_9FIRM|nr:DUF4367 domain-containing protein [Desulfoscipio gibsoniae]AGL02459.1 hypothetical protein Desgi_3089 [Desulfoscipio gibsoniae DSM 7213]
MAGKERSEMLFDALLKVAVTETFQKELDALPSNEELNETYKPSPELDRRIKKLIYQSQRKSKIRHFAKRFAKVAVCIAIVFTFLNAVLLSVEATRNSIFNAIIAWQEKYTEVKFGESKKESQQDNVYRPTYLPEGYKETAAERYGNTFTIIYTNNAGEEILFDQRPAESGTSLVDNENTEYTKVKISDNTAYLFKAMTTDDSNVLIWQSDGLVYELISKIDSTELIRIGESLKK